MSRIGNKPIALPKGVTVTVADGITVKGPKGELTRALVDGTTVAVENDTLTVARASDSRTHRANHGIGAAACPFDRAQQQFAARSNTIAEAGRLSSEAS